jgi:16S rRNA (guanine1207-N2)-methyltransferase
VVALGEHYFSERPSSPERRGLVRCVLRGLQLEFLTSSGVFSHKRVDPGTALLIKSMVLPEEGSVLDLGCGYGPVGVAAGRLRPRLEVVLTDVNERAVELARENLRRNGVANGVALRGGLYGPVAGRRFDVVLSNPPFSAGFRGAVGPMVEGATGHLAEGGSLQVVVRLSKGGRMVAALMEDAFGCFEVLARGGGYRVLMSIRA